MNIKPITIAVDGFSSCGKSTFAKLIAQRLDYLYIDSGAMYRAVAFACIRNNTMSNSAIDEDKLARLLDGLEVGFSKKSQSDGWVTTLNGEPVEEHIRSLEVSRWVSKVAAIPMVRHTLVAQQQRMGESKSIVMDGRDIGTVVFPHAELKIFMTADPLIRAQRRLNEMEMKGERASLQEVLENIAERDRIDQTREESPLRKAEDAVELDNSQMTLPEQMQWFEQLLAERFCNNG